MGEMKIIMFQFKICIFTSFRRSLLFLNLYVLAKFRILRVEAGMLHVLVKPLGT